MLAHQEVSAVIVRARGAEELASIFGAATLPITRSEIAVLDRASA